MPFPQSELTFGQQRPCGRQEIARDPVPVPVDRPHRPPDLNAVDQLDGPQHLAGFGVTLPCIFDGTLQLLRHGGQVEIVEVSSLLTSIDSEPPAEGHSPIPVLDILRPCDDQLRPGLIDGQRAHARQCRRVHNALACPAPASGMDRNTVITGRPAFSIMEVRGRSDVRELARVAVASLTALPNRSSYCSCGESETDEYLREISLNRTILPEQARSGRT